MGDAFRIDVHQHLLPPEFIAALERHGMSGWAPVKWSAEGAVAVMDDHKIATGILSLSTPGTHFGDNREARQLTRTINERLASLVNSRPDRFGMFASVPLPDIDGSLEAIAQAYDEFHTDGIVLIASTHGKYLGDPEFDLIFAELDRRGAVVYVHPTQLQGPPAAGIHPVLADLLLDTTRAAINMVLHGIPRRYPNLKIILSHGGGFLPYSAYRIASLASVIDPAVSYDNVIEDLASFYFDTGLASSPSSLPSLLQFARPGRVLFGTDWPYCLDRTVTFFTDSLDSYDGLDAAGHAAVNHQNARVLFPRLR